MADFLASFGTFIYNFISYISTSYFGYLVGGLLVVSSLFALVYRLARRGY